MATRTIIEIDQDRCDGCGACETGCPEGALKVIGGKARLVGESLCDGLGACIGRCPKDAIHVVEREADGYDEAAVLEELLPQGPDVLKAHFAHLDHHGQDLYLRKAVEFLKARNIAAPEGYERFEADRAPVFTKPCGRPEGFAHAHAPTASGRAGQAASPASPASSASSAKNAAREGAAFPNAPSGTSSLENWPIQLHLVNPRAPAFAGADVLVAADCTAFALGAFHADLLSGRSLVIACPKLDSGKDVYLSKLTSIFAQAKSVSAAIMEVPCCSGLLRLLQDAREASGSALPIQALVIGIDGGFVARKTL